ncbi:hypothetical protein G3I13_01855 [Streptomyces sp. SID6673]|nr:hypothetical protein [Streptomyces sp. SID11726]NDZ94905.1 hypothetical protein [Streptomyces sp. SID11726]NEB23065.1 hypothetical protein [Streptomyces sp. SID6673]
MTQHIGDLLGAINQPRDLRPVVTRETYLETGELPAEVDELINNKAYLPRHRKLQRLHGDRVLLKVAELCHGKDGKGRRINDPQKYYARMTSLASWNRTLTTVKRLLAATERAVAIMQKLGADPQWLRWYVGVVYRNSEATVAQWVERATAAKRGSPPRLFAWLASDISSRSARS